MCRSTAIRIPCWVACAFVLASSVRAQTPTITFTAQNNEYWHDASNWSTSQLPGASDIVYIPATQVAVIAESQCLGGTNDHAWCNGPEECTGGGVCTKNPDAVAGAVLIDGDGSFGSNDGKIVLEAFTSLTLHQDSEVDGELFVNGAAYLHIAAPLAIQGIGEIKTQCQHGYCPNAQATIDALGTCVGGSNDGNACPPCGTPQQCSECTDICPGGVCQAPPTMPALTLQTATSDPEDFKLRGRWRTCIPLVNNATVVSNCSFNPMLIEADGNTGNGVWRAEKDPDEPQTPNFGIMEVNGSVAGSGTWQVTHTSGDRTGVIYVNAPCTGLTGDIELDGPLYINANLTTTGNLYLGITSISVAQGAVARFDVAPPPPPPPPPPPQTE